MRNYITFKSFLEIEEHNNINQLVALLFMNSDFIKETRPFKETLFIIFYGETFIIGTELERIVLGGFINKVYGLGLKQ